MLPFGSAAGTRLKVGISACLLGEQVRYNGDHKRADHLAALSPYVEWIPVCPEVEIGMGVPREPVQLERVEGALRMMSVQSRVDFTHRMAAWAERRVDELAATGICGYVLKKDSPSCGVTTVKIYEHGKLVDNHGRGLFAAILMSRLRGLPVAEEHRLANPVRCGEFLKQCSAYQDRR